MVAEADQMIGADVALHLDKRLSAALAAWKRASYPRLKLMPSPGTMPRSFLSPVVMRPTVRVLTSWMFWRWGFRPGQ